MFTMKNKNKNKNNFNYKHFNLISYLASPFLTIVNLGCKLAKPPGGNDEQPVANWRNDLRSSPVIPTNTLTKRRKPGLKINIKSTSS